VGEFPLLGRMRPRRADSVSTLRGSQWELCRGDRRSLEGRLSLELGRRRVSLFGAWWLRIHQRRLVSTGFVPAVHWGSTPLGSSSRAGGSGGEIVRGLSLGLRGLSLGRVSLFRKEAYLWLFWLLSGAWRRHHLGRAPLARALQLPPSLLSSYCNSYSWQCCYPRSCSI
jgi:hypothetical protein